MTRKLKIICAWCHTLIQDGIEPIFFGKKRASHGICKKCSAKLENKFKRNQNEKENN